MRVQLQRRRQNNSPDQNTQSATLSFIFHRFFFFTLALLSKPMVITLPLVLLLLDFWPLNRNCVNAGIEISVPRCFRRGSCCSKKFRSLFSPCSIALPLSGPKRNRIPWSVPRCCHFSRGLPTRSSSYVLYLWKTVCPVGLALPYPYHEWMIHPPHLAAAALLLLLVSGGRPSLGRAQSAVSRCRLVFGFLIMLLPVIGLNAESAYSPWQTVTLTFH